MSNTLLLRAIAAVVALLVNLPLCAYAEAAPHAKEVSSVFIEELTTTELSSWVGQRRANVIVYSGGVEETGPHIVLGKHNLRVRLYAERIARQLGDTLVAPVIPLAPNSDVLKAFAGTLSLEESTFTAVNEELARSLAASGFRTVIFMADHFNSQALLKSLASRLDAEFAPRGIRVYFCSNVYAKAREDIEAEVRRAGKVPGGHGGLWDTAETLAAAKSAVRLELMAPGNLEDDGNGALDKKGMSGDPRGATAAMGRHFADIRVRLAVAEIRSFLRSVEATPVEGSVH